MPSWSGQPLIRGRSEVVRMTLLTFVSVGITFVHPIVPSSILRVARMGTNETRC